MYSTTGPDASNFVSTYNTAFYSIAIVALVLLVALTALMLYFIFRYNKKKNATATQIEGSTRLEVTWTVIPVIMVIFMFHYGWAGWKPMANPPKDATNVTTVARMWSFSFKYDNGRDSKDLVLQVNTPVKINLISLDVIHSLYIPAFRIKSDIIPGRKKMMWFIPERVGEFELYCAEYCGLQHSYMKANVKVLSNKDYAAWYSDTSAVKTIAAGTTPTAEGLKIMISQGCMACHSTDGTKIVGPSYLNLYGKKEVVQRDGKEITITVDDEYIKRSIYDPNYDIVKGFPRNLMQSYKETLKDDDIKKIIEYLKSLNEK